MARHHVPVGVTPVPQYATWEDHRRALHEAADETRANRAAYQPIQQPAAPVPAYHSRAVPVGATPVPQYATWEDHRNALHQAAEVAQANRAAQHAVAVPSIELIDKPESVTVLAELPGFDRDSIQLQASESILIISATRDGYEGQGKTLHNERPLRVERSIQLPTNTIPDEAEATYENGVLEITLPKEEGQQTTITIT